MSETSPQHDARSTTPPGAGSVRRRVALVTGITGQDGSYLTELLLEKGYEVHGIVRRASLFNTARIDHLYLDPHTKGGRRMNLHHGDLTDANGLARLIRMVHPDEVYNLAAQSHVRVSFEMPVHTADITGVGALKLLEVVREYQEETGRQVRFYQASSSEQYGGSIDPNAMQDESTPFVPRSPYACAKAFAHHATVNYREAYGMHCSCGILFNHESPRRGETFVTRKITRAVGRIKLGLQEKVYLGNLDARRDWGFAGDYVRAMWLMLQQETPGDYVVATGRSLSVREFARLAFAHVGLDADEYIVVDPRYLRPSEVPALLGDATKAKRVLGWTPTTTIERLAAMMVEADLELARREKTLRDAGHDINEGTRLGS